MGPLPAYDPEYINEEQVSSSSHEAYHPVAIQIASHANTFDATTGYQDTYKAWELPQRAPPAPVQLRQSVPFDATTSYSDTYKPYEVQPRHVVQRPQYAGSGAKFDGHTSYEMDYPAHAIQPRAPPAPVSPNKSSAKFEGVSSYTDQFPAHAVAPRGPMLPPRELPANIPWDATTSYQDTYKAYELQPRAPPAPVVAPKSTAKFDGTTTYNTAHQPYTIEPRPPAVNKFKYEPTPFEGESEAHDKFKAWELEKRAPPAVIPIRPSLPFSGTTTNQDTFKGWALPARRPSLGIAMVGDQLYKLIPHSMATPCTAKQTFTTVHRNQGQMCMMVYAGDDAVASRNTLLGQFQLVKLPESQIGDVQVEVSFHLDADNVLSVEAKDLCTGRHHLWKSGGGAIIAQGIDREKLKNGIVPYPAQNAIPVA
ncbi:hypothetical protein WJX84_002506 [Apatococcus fuscideae]|uniref:Uncharacterized protein n=1 Tax=Apatococcus fuscideae TaxID=2026836 RepID=A0AAW1T7N3_9CHLO